MSAKEFKLLLFNGVNWKVSYLGEDVLLLECNIEVPIEKIHQSSTYIEKRLGARLSDIVSAYQSIAVFTALDLQEFCQIFQNEEVKGKVHLDSATVFKVPICYELGLDLERIENHSGLSVEEVISTHLNGKYRCVFIGFNPGFIYSDGLDEIISCPRQDNPRKKVPMGSIGIAGNQTGIYSLASPGGWNIIGRTPMKIFDKEKIPPMSITVGMQYKFYRISKEEFDTWEG